MFDNVRNNGTQGFLAQHGVNERNLFRHVLVHDDAAGGGLDHLGALAGVLLVLGQADEDGGMHVDDLFVIGDDYFLGAVELEAVALCTGTLLGDVVQTQHHILGGNGNRRTVGRIQDVVRAQHQELCLHDGGIAQRQVDGHLVTVEVRIECGTGERMQLDGLALNHARLESLDTQTVQGRCTVQEHRMAFHHVFQDVPDNGIPAVHNLLGALYGFDDAALDELADHKRLVKLGRHEFGKTALVHVEFRTHDDNRTGGIVHTLTQEVLAEAALLTLQGVGQGLEGTVALALDGRTLLGIVEQAVHRFLQHTFFVAQNHFRGLDLDEFLESVVADNHATVEVVEVTCGETAAVQRNQRTQVRRSDGNHLHNHPFRTVHVLGLLEPLHDAQALEDIGLALLGTL